MNETERPPCMRCGAPVERNVARYDTFEHMHWLCFHLEFEHLRDGQFPADPDIACRDPKCPARAFDDQAVPNWETDPGLKR